MTCFYLIFRCLGRRLVLYLILPKRGSMTASICQPFGTCSSDLKVAVVNFKGNVTILVVMVTDSAKGKSFKGKLMIRDKSLRTFCHYHHPSFRTQAKRCNLLSFSKYTCSLHVWAKKKIKLKVPLKHVTHISQCLDIETIDTCPP